MKSKARKTTTEYFPGGNKEKVINVMAKQNRKGTKSKIVKRKGEITTHHATESVGGRSYINGSKEVIKYKNGVEVKRKKKEYKNNLRGINKVMNM